MSLEMRVKEYIDITLKPPITVQDIQSAGQALIEVVPNGTPLEIVSLAGDSIRLRCRTHDVDYHSRKPR